MTKVIIVLEIDDEKVHSETLLEYLTTESAKYNFENMGVDITDIKIQKG